MVKCEIMRLDFVFVTFRDEKDQNWIVPCLVAEKRASSSEIQLHNTGLNYPHKSSWDWNVSSLNQLLVGNNLVCSFLD